MSGCAGDFFAGNVVASLVRSSLPVGSPAGPAKKKDDWILRGYGGGKPVFFQNILAGR
jgi:hypothetical protein